MFLNPEAEGKQFHGEITGHNLNGSMLGVSLSSTSAEPSLETAKSQVALGGTSTIGAHEYLDFYAKLGTHSPNLFGVKLQVWGENQIDTHSGNLSVSILFGGGQSNYSGAGNENFALNLTTGTYTLNRTHTSTHMGALVGWRWEKYILLYSSLTKISENIHGTVDFDGSPADGEEIDVNGNHMQLSLGYLYEYKKYNLMAEYSFQQMKWQGDRQKLIQTFNFGFGVDY